MDVRQGALEGMEVIAAFWEGRRVLVTGHTGFKGAWLCFWLSNRGAKVAGYALPAIKPSVSSLLGDAWLERSALADIRDAAEVQKLVDDFRPEIVFHLAAQSLVRLGYKAPLETFEVNVMGTANLLEACRRCSSVRAIVVITTDKCYENLEWEWGYRESDRLGGRDPYSNSKACAELVVSCFQQSFFHSDHCSGLASARAGNVIGGGDWSEDRLIPDLVRAAAAALPLTLRNPDAIRPWQHVLEPLSGYMSLAERLFSNPGQFSTAWNFGPDDDAAKSVEWIVRTFERAWKSTLVVKLQQADQPHEAKYLKLDSSRAHKRLQWRPRLSIEEAIDWTIDWYKAHESGQDMGKFTMRQIQAYEGLMGQAI